MDRPTVHRALAAATLAAAALAAAPAPARAQSLASRIAAVRDGTVRMSFAARPGVCGDGENFHIRRPTAEWEGGCGCSGPVRVALTLRDRNVTRVKTYVGGRWRPSPEAADLGTVSAPEAAAFLLDLAATPHAAAGKDAVFPATLADSAVAWPRLLEIARNPAIPARTRSSAVFWVGQEAARAATDGLEAIVDDDGDLEVRKSAVFALSQRPAAEGVPALIRIARTSPSPELRRVALFWLSRSDDPRALALFEELLAGT